MTSWSLTRELLKITNANTEREALVLLNLLSDKDDDYVLECKDDWKRGGAETYIYVFSITSKSIENVYIIKACVVPDFDKGIEGVITEWIKRRTLLRNNNISVPNLIYYGNGMIIEEYIQHLLVDVIRSKPFDLFFDGLVEYTACLSKLGFAPVDAFSDLRTRGEDIVVVDFGQDLGPAMMVKPPNLHLLTYLEKVMQVWGMLSENSIKLLHDRYSKSLKRKPSISA